MDYARWALVALQVIKAAIDLIESIIRLRKLMGEARRRE